MALNQKTHSELLLNAHDTARPAPPKTSPGSMQSSGASTLRRFASAVAPNSLVKAFGWASALVGGAVGLESYGKAPWQKTPELVPVAACVDDLAHLKLPAFSARKQPEKQAEPQVSAATIPSPEVPHREVLKASFETISCILFERAGSLAPDVDLSSPEHAFNTVLLFRNAILEMPRHLKDKYQLWTAISDFHQNFKNPDATLRFGEAVQAIAARQPVPEASVNTNGTAKMAAPKPAPDAPFSKNSANGQYYEVREEAIPALVSYLEPFDAVLKAAGVESPEKRLESAHEASLTLRNYADSLRQLDRSSPAARSLRQDADELRTNTKATLTRFIADRHYQLAKPQLEASFNTFLDHLEDTLSPMHQDTLTRDFTSIASATETLRDFRTCLELGDPGSPSLSDLDYVIKTLGQDPKSLVPYVTRLGKASNNPNFGKRYESVKAEALPLIVEELSRHDAIFKLINGYISEKITPPEKKLESLPELLETLSKYQAIWQTISPTNGGTELFAARIKGWLSSPSKQLKAYKEAFGESVADNRDVAYEAIAEDLGPLLQKRLAPLKEKLEGVDFPVPEISLKSADEVMTTISDFQAAIAANTDFKLRGGGHGKLSVDPFVEITLLLEKFRADPIELHKELFNAQKEEAASQKP